MTMDTLQIDGDYMGYPHFGGSPADLKAIRAIYRKQFGTDASPDMPYETVYLALVAGHPDPDSYLDDDPDQD